VAILSLLTRFNPKLPTDGWKVVKVEKTERVTMNVVILLNQACLEPLAASIRCSFESTTPIS